MRTLKSVLEDFARECRLTAAAADTAMNAAAAQARAWEVEFPDAAAKRHAIARWESLKRDKFIKMAEDAEKFIGQCSDWPTLPEFPGY